MSQKKKKVPLTPQHLFQRIHFKMYALEDRYATFYPFRVMFNVVDRPRSKSVPVLTKESGLVGQVNEAEPLMAWWISEVF